MVLLTVVILAVGRIDYFSRFQLISSDRRVRLQNEVTYILEHMTKSLVGTADTGGAIGNISTDGNSINLAIDSDKDGRWSNTSDRNIWYRYNVTPFNIMYNNGITSENLATRGVILNNTYSYTDNYINVSITARWDPGKDRSPENPEITMNTTIIMPSVSAQR